MDNNEENLIFLSLVGQQAQGVLHPLRACLATPRFSGIETVVLLATNETRGHAEDLRKYCEDKGLPPVEILDWLPGTNPDDVAGLLGDSDRVILNTGGGTSFDLSRLASRLAALVDEARIAVLCTSKGKVRLVPRDGSDSVALKAPDPIPIRELLALQNLHREKSDTSSSFFGRLERVNASAWKDKHVVLPADRLENVEIGGVFFDLVWNDGTDTPVFLRLVDFDTDNKRLLATLRAVAAWANSKEGSSYLYHRDVIVFCPGERATEHVADESNHKARARNADIPNALFAKELRDLFQTSDPERLPDKGRRTIPSDSLVTSLGTDEAPTLLAAVSHGLPNLFLCCTQDEDMLARVERVRGLVASGRLAPVKKLVVVPSNHEGSVLSRNLQLEKDATNVHVNVTPGTKGQSVFLALWARKHGVPAWSIFTRGHSLTRIDTGTGDAGDGSPQTLPLRPLDATVILKAKFDSAPEEHVLTEEERTCSALLLDHMQACLDRGVDWGQVHGHKLRTGESQTLNGLVLSNVGDGRWRVSGPRGTGEFKRDKGDWFEWLTLVALERAGATRLHNSVRLPWSESIQEELERTKDGNVFRQEMDVLGCWRESTFLVSCKTNIDASTTVKDVEREARSMAGSVARFTVPFVCILYREQFAQEIADLHTRTVFFGWKELCDPKKLGELLERSIGSYRSK